VDTTVILPPPPLRKAIVVIPVPFSTLRGPVEIANAVRRSRSESQRSARIGYPQRTTKL
jgi:hypothetical protein